MIDWIIAQRIATFVAGTGDARAPSADLGALATEAEIRVVAYTGLEPSRPLPPPEGISRREWVETNIGSMRLLLDPVLKRASENLGPLKPAVEIGMGIVLSTEVGVVLGYLAQRVLGQYELLRSTRSPTPSSSPACRGFTRTWPVWSASSCAAPRSGSRRLARRGSRASTRSGG
jgi:hypothetical protein